MTPDWARTILSMEPSAHARRNPTAVSEYAAIMKSDGWVLNGQPIVFGKRGRVIDGVQRLFACVEADTPFDTALVYGVEEAIAHTIDQHARRSFQNVLESRGIRDAGAIVRIASWMLRYQRGEAGLPASRARAISWVRIDRFISEHPEIQDGIEIALRSPRMSAVPATAREIVAVFGCAAGKSEEVRRFINDLSYGAKDKGLTGANRPGHTLGLQAWNMRAAGAPLRGATAIALTLLAFQDHLDGKPGRFHEWKPDYAGVELRPNGRPVHWRHDFPPNFNMPVPAFIPVGLRPMPELISSRDSSGRQMVTMRSFEAPALDLASASSPAARTEASLFDGTPGTLAESYRRMAANAAIETLDMRIETVTPDMAREWLATFNFKNRRIQKTNVGSFVRDMRNGRWKLNGQPICFSVERRLINGQHRLEACAEADIPIDFLVMRGLPDEAFATYDIQARKAVVADLHDQLIDDDATNDPNDPQAAMPVYSGGNVDNRVIDAAAKLLWEDERGGRQIGVQPTSSEILDTLKRHPQLSDGYAQARRMKHIGSSGVMTYLIYAVTRENPEIANDFLEALERGAGLTVENPLLRKRDEILANRSGRQRRDTARHLLSVWRDYAAWRQRKDKAEARDARRAAREQRAGGQQPADRSDGASS